MDQINERFSDFFRSMQCAGEVDLHSENEVRMRSVSAAVKLSYALRTSCHGCPVLSYSISSYETVDLLLFIQWTVKEIILVAVFCTAVVLQRMNAE